MPQPRTWDQILWDHLCALYQLWGGDCSELPPRPTYPGKQVWDTYKAEGPPQFPDEAARQACINLLNEISAHLASSENTLTTAQNAEMQALIQGLLDDLGA